MPTTDGTVVRGGLVPATCSRGASAIHTCVCLALQTESAATLPDQVSQGLQDGPGHPKTAPPAEEGWGPDCTASDPSSLTAGPGSEASTSRKLSLL